MAETRFGTMPRAKAAQPGLVTTKSKSVLKIFFIVVSSKVVMVTRLKCLRVRGIGVLQVWGCGALGTQRPAPLSSSGLLS